MNLKTACSNKILSNHVEVLLCRYQTKTAQIIFAFVLFDFKFVYLICILCCIKNIYSVQKKKRKDLIFIFSRKYNIFSKSV